MLTQDDLLEIKARCEAQLPAPWFVGVGDVEGECVLMNDNHYRIASSQPHIEMMEHNPESLLEFCAAARKDIPALLAHIEKLQSQLTEA